MADHYFEGIIQRHKPGRGSKPVPLERHVEAAQKSKPVVRCKQGESFEAMVEREKLAAFNRAQLARRDYIAALEDARRAGSIIQRAHDVFDDLEGDCWADIPRTED